MAQMNRISDEEYRTLFTKERFDTQDRFKLQSASMYPLADACKELSYGDYDTIHTLEEKNLYRLLNVASILAGAFGEDVQSQLLGLPKCRLIINQCQPGTDLTKRESDRGIYMLIMRHALSNFNDNIKAPAVFDGKMPQKLFQFRQQTADEWFNKIVEQVSFIAGSIYADQDLEEATAYVMGYIAFYLNRSQPGKYGADVDKNDNDNVYKIIRTFVDSVSGDYRTIQPIFSARKTL